MTTCTTIIERDRSTGEFIFAEGLVVLLAHKQPKAERQRIFDSMETYAKDLAKISSDELTFSSLHQRADHRCIGGQ